MKFCRQFHRICSSPPNSFWRYFSFWIHEWRYRVSKQHFKLFWMPARQALCLLSHSTSLWQTLTWKDFKSSCLFSGICCLLLTSWLPFMSEVFCLLTFINPVSISFLCFRSLSLNVSYCLEFSLVFSFWCLLLHEDNLSYPSEHLPSMCAPPPPAQIPLSPISLFACVEHQDSLSCPVYLSTRMFHGLCLSHSLWSFCVASFVSFPLFYQCVKLFCTFLYSFCRVIF
jgi:hypothetical protein